MQTTTRRRIMTAGLTLAAVGWNLLQTPAAVAAGDWRPTYDIIMMWVNFAILATVLFKLLRHPLGNFFRTQRDAVKTTLETLENEKSRIEDEIQALRASLADRQQRTLDVHERMVAQGEEERRELITEARQEAERRLLKARQLIEARHREAYRKLRDEIIDTAVGRAMAELPKHVTPEVEQALTDRFLQSISGPQE